MIKNMLKHSVTYAVFVDIVILSFVIAFGFIVSEALLPGIISIYISPFALFAGATALLLVVIKIAHMQNISFEKNKKNILMFLIGMFIFVGLCAIASFRFGVLLGVAFVGMSTLILLLFYRSFLEKIS